MLKEACLTSARDANANVGLHLETLAIKPSTLYRKPWESISLPGNFRKRYDSGYVRGLGMPFLTKSIKKRRTIASD